MPAALAHLSYQQFRHLIADNVGEVLPTAGGKASFRAELTNTGVVFHPTSTGKPRRLTQRLIEPYLEKFNRHNSTKVSDYADHRNHSYVLAFFQLHLGQAAEIPRVSDDSDTSGDIDPEFGVQEGKERLRSHRCRERSRELVQLAKKAFRAKHGRLFCQVCGFDFDRTYGEPDFIEVHHLIPLKDLQEGQKTKLSDLAMVCPNCHRMLHRGNPWPTIAELKARLKRRR